MSAQLSQPGCAHLMGPSSHGHVSIRFSFSLVFRCIVGSRWLRLGVVAPGRGFFYHNYGNGSSWFPGFEVGVGGVDEVGGAVAFEVYIFPCLPEGLE